MIHCVERLDFECSVSNRLDITVKIKLKNESDKRKIRFALGDEWVIDYVSADEGEVRINSVGQQEIFFFSLRMYEVEFENAHELYITYHGIPSGNHTYFQDNLVAFNLYSCWYPISADDGFETYFPATIEIEANPKYTLVKGRRDESKFFYTALDMDYNIILMEDPFIIEEENFRAYCMDESSSLKAEQYLSLAEGIAKYYKKLFGKEIQSESGKMDFVFLPEFRGDAYVRKGLIVFGELIKDDFRFAKLLAHELGHIRFSGAALNWEDWMNETFAEWSAILYLLENTNEDITKIIQQHRGELIENERIKPADLHRPEDVHSRGTVLLYDMVYEKFGKQGIIEIMKSFLEINTKDTESLLANLHLKNRESGDILRVIIES